VVWSSRCRELLERGTLKTNLAEPIKQRELSASERRKVLDEICREDGLCLERDFNLWLRWKFLEVGLAAQH
jgi:hypothetical protein